MDDKDSRMDRFYDELRQFLDGPEVKRTWDDVFASDAKRIKNHIAKIDEELEIETHIISRSKVRITIKKINAFYVKTSHYAIISGKDEFLVISIDVKRDKTLRISFESLRYDPRLTSKENVIKKIEEETSKFFEDVKVICYPYDTFVDSMIMKIVLFNKQEFDSCDRE